MGASFGPPDQVFGKRIALSIESFANVLLEMGKFVHDVENEMFCESINPKIPYFNAPIYLENKVHIPGSIAASAFRADATTDTNW